MKKLQYLIAGLVILGAIVGLRRCGNTPQVPVATVAQVKPKQDTQIMEQEKITWQPTEEEQKVIDATEAMFWGKIVDQKGVPVPNAEVVIQPNNDPWVANLRRRTIRADAQGLFTIREPNAASMSISTSALGYYPTKESSGSFGFATLPASAPEGFRRRWTGTTKTSSGSPHVFILKKMAPREPLLNLSKVGDLKEHQSYQIGSRQEQRIEVKYWFDPAVKRMHVHGWPVHDWGVEISVVNGGLAQTKRPDYPNSDEFVAPENGYQPSIRFAFDSSMSDEDVKFGVGSHFFVKFSDNTYARIDANFDSAITRPRWRIESWYNPSGGRSTEFDSSIQIEAPSK